MILLKHKHKRTDSIRESMRAVWNDIQNHQDDDLKIYVVSNNKRSVNQNAFYWMIVNEIAKEEGSTKETCHTSLKCLFLKVADSETVLKDIDEIIYPDWGMLPRLAKDIPESKKLNKVDFSEYWRRCIQFGVAAFGLDIPENPNEMTAKQYERYLEQTVIK